jgi:hypothetical protein
VEPQILLRLTATPFQLIAELVGFRAASARFECRLETPWGGRFTALDCCSVAEVAIPGARFELLQDTGHLPQMESPGLLLETVWDFARRVASRYRAPPAGVPMTGPGGVAPQAAAAAGVIVEQ